MVDCGAGASGGTGSSGGSGDEGCDASLERVDGVAEQIMFVCSLLEQYLRFVTVQLLLGSEDDESQLRYEPKWENGAEWGSGWLRHIAQRGGGGSTMRSVCVRRCVCAGLARCDLTNKMQSLIGAYVVLERAYIHRSVTLVRGCAIRGAWRCMDAWL